MLEHIIHVFHCNSIKLAVNASVFLHGCGYVVHSRLDMVRMQAGLKCCLAYITAPSAHCMALALEVGLIQLWFHLWHILQLV